jgi:hypothetical protein
VYRHTGRDIFQYLCLLLLLRAFWPFGLSGFIFFLTAISISLFQVLAHLSAAAWYAGAIYVLFVAFYLINGRDMAIFPVRALLFSSMLGGLITFLPSYPFSMGQQAAVMIKQSDARDARWAAYPDYTGTVPFAVLARSFHSFECDCESTFTQWGPHRLAQRPDLSVLRERIQRFVDASAASDAYVLVSQPSANLFRSAIPPDVHIDQIFQTGRALRGDESFLAWRLSKLPNELP